jgi:hypothetical protein
MEYDVKEITYEELLLLPPEKRVREPSGDLLNDKISGILIAFSWKLKLRDSHIDIITLSDAKKEIENLIKETNKP